MKHLFSIKIILIILFLKAYNLNGQGTGYIATKGNQFVDENGSPFYALTMTYDIRMMMYYCPPVGEPQYFVSPKYTYGPTPYPCFQCTTKTSCLAKIADDFANIKAMGFNTVHVSALCPNTSENEDYPGNYFWLDLIAIDREWHWNYHHPFNSPLISDPFVNEIFSGISDIATLAANADLKLIIDGEVAHIWPTQAYRDLYTEYLDLLSAYIVANNVPMMAYFVTGEPSYNNLNLNSQNTKQQVCDATHAWYDAIRNNDANHLIGCGFLDLENLFTWDPGIQKMDFLQPHVYMTFREYEDAVVSGNHHNLAQAIDRNNAQLYWFKNNCPVPWMVGETGFITYTPNGYVSPPCTSSTCLSNVYTPIANCSGAAWNPAVHYGDDSEQQTYFSQNMQMARNCGAQGYAVWEYQDAVDFDDCGFNYGLLRSGDTDPSNLNAFTKPAVVEFINYLNAQGQPPPAVPLTSPPNNYYDPMHTAQYTQFGSLYNISGTVVDQNGAPIKDAFIRAHTYLDFEVDNFGNRFPIDNIFYTFTSAAAVQNFTLTPFNSKDPSTASKQYIRWLEVTSLGSSNSGDGDWGNFPDCISCSDPFHQVQNGNTFSLNRISLNLNSIVQNQTVNSGNSPATFQAWRTLIVSTNNTIQSGGVADFKALDEVNVEDEFHAEYGSEVHIYNETVLAECSDITAAGGFRQSANQSASYQNSQDKSFELIFKKKDLPETVSVVPNPNSGSFKISYEGNVEEIKKLTVFDVVGNSILNSNFTGNNVNLDLSLQPKGIYFLEVKSKTSILNKKIIIQ